MHLPTLLLACLLRLAAGVDYSQVEYDYEDDQYVDNKDMREFHVIAADVNDDKPDKVIYEKVDCSEVMEERVKVMEDSMCTKLVDVYVNTSEDSLYSYSPTRVKVKRCGGMCSTRQDCMPTRKTIVMIPVERTMLLNQVKDCAYAIVEQHIECMCKCVIKKNDCKGKQMYNENACECRCEDMANKKGKCNHNGHSWDGPNCECRCPFGDMSCPPGYKWDTEHCKCNKKRKIIPKRRPSWLNRL